MRNLIDRKLEISSWKKVAPDERYPVDEIIESLRRAPSVDVVVRCKDCKYGSKLIGGTIACIRTVIYPMGVKADDFCSWGEKE